MIVTAKLFAQLPKDLRHQGEPSPWAKMTRPGMAIDSFLEAAFFDDVGNLWLSDVPYGRVFRVSPSGAWEQVHQIDGELHAMRIAPDGQHIAVDYRHGLISLKDDGFEVLSDGYLGLSDMSYGPDGRLWFTDSGRSSLASPIGKVWVWDGVQARCVADCVPYSNGIAVSPDNAWVYVAATRANQVWKFSTRLPETDAPMVGTYLFIVDAQFGAVFEARLPEGPKA